MDSYSKWLEVVETNGMSSNVVIQELRKVMSVHGLPDSIVLDNGPAFSSHEYKSYLKRFGIVQIFTAPYHPASNGLVERAI